MIIALDATQSREKTWDAACHITGEMFEATAALGGIAIQLAYYRGFDECKASNWFRTAVALHNVMRAVTCLGGQTQIERILRHAINKAEEQPVSALVFIGDAMEEEADLLCGLAGKLGALSACRSSVFTRASTRLLEPASGRWRGLITIDHVSQSMQHEEMLTWLLFYTSLLRTRKTPVQDVLDPGGIVHSQVVETEDGEFRLVLNASQSRHTQSSRFLSDFFASGVQHIAFATDDIFATVARLRASGVALLPIPENYYDDLEARIDLDADLRDRLRGNDVLYDRQGAGEFFQAYTRNFDGGFFFEIVQRRKYGGFGASNAPIRLAAQTRLAAVAAAVA